MWIRMVPVHAEISVCEESDTFRLHVVDRHTSNAFPGTRYGIDLRNEYKETRNHQLADVLQNMKIELRQDCAFL